MEGMKDELHVARQGCDKVFSLMMKKASEEHEDLCAVIKSEKIDSGIVLPAFLHEKDASNAECCRYVQELFTAGAKVRKSIAAELDLARLNGKGAASSQPDANVDDDLGRAIAVAQDAERRVK